MSLATSQGFSVKKSIPLSSISTVVVVVFYNKSTCVLWKDSRFTWAPHHFGSKYVIVISASEFVVVVVVVVVAVSGASSTFKSSLILARKSRVGAREREVELMN